jgi:hypothetical protein
MKSLRNGKGKVVKIGREMECGLYETIVLHTEPSKDAVGMMRPSAKDLLCQEVVRQVLALPSDEQLRIREMLGTKNRYPNCDVAVCTRSKP